MQNYRPPPPDELSGDADFIVKQVLVPAYTAESTKISLNGLAVSEEQKWPFGDETCQSRQAGG